MLTQPLTPDFVRFQAGRQPVKLHASFQAVWLLTGGLVAAGFSVVAPFVGQLYRIWTVGKLPFDAGLFIALALAVALRLAGLPLIQYLTSNNYLTAQSSITWVRGGVTLSAAMLLLPRYGLTGLGIAVVSGELMGSFILPIFFSQRFFREMNWHLSSGDWLFPLLHASIIATTGALVFFTKTPNWISAIAGVGGASALTLCQWHILLPEVRQRLGGMLPMGLVWLGRKSPS